MIEKNIERGREVLEKTKVKEPKVETPTEEK